MAQYFLNLQLTIMKTKKLLFITLTLLCFSFVANAQRGVRIGYIDMEYILENVPEYKEASTQLNGKVQRWKKDLEKKNDQIELLKINLSTERVLLTTELIEEREEDINVLEDENLRQGIKDFSDWPTIPQLYVKSEFIGGCDIIKEMFEKGELKKLFEEKKII